VAGLFAHGIGLAPVLRNTGVYSLHDIRADRGVEDLCNTLISLSLFPIIPNNPNPRVSIPSPITTQDQNTELNRTFGRGCVAPLAVPSAERIVTVGRDAIVGVGGRWLLSKLSLKCCRLLLR
jgi:hypothetical protein